MEEENSLRWMCTMMSYKLNIPGGRLLGANPGSFETTFHPFQRGFFTLLEQRIDTAILEKLYKDVPGVAEMPEIDDEDVPDIVETDNDNQVNEATMEEQNEVELSDQIVEEKVLFQGWAVDNREEHEKDAMTITSFGNHNEHTNRVGPGGDSSMPWANQDRPPNRRHFSSDSGFAENDDCYISALEQSSLQSHSGPDFPHMFKSGSTVVAGLESGGIAIQDVQDVQLVITADGQTPPPSGCVADTSFPFLNTLLFNFGLDAAPDSPPEAPTEYVVKGGFLLFGLIPAELHSLQTSSTSGIHQRVTLAGGLSLGTLLPTLAGSPLDAITLTDTTLTYRSRPTLTLPAGLTLATTIHLSGFLDPINTVLRDIFGQDKPRIDFSGLISTEPDCLKQPPIPSGFTLRGELPEISITLFDVLELTHLGVSITGRRISSAGGYDYGYGFDGRGRIADLDVDLSMRKHHDHYRMMLAMTGDIWKNVGGVVGINVSWFLCGSRPIETDTVQLENVQFDAAWQGTSIATVQLGLKASFKLRSASMLLRGAYSKSV